MTDTDLVGAGSWRESDDATTDEVLELVALGAPQISLAEWDAGTDRQGVWVRTEALGREGAETEAPSRYYCAPSKVASEEQ